MEFTVGRLMWAWTILGCLLYVEVPGVGSASLPDITDNNFIDDCVQAHNRARSSVKPAARNMLYMTWDKDLAITARAWAKNCLFQHNIHLGDVRRVHPVFSSVGENIWAGYPPSKFTVKSAIDSWINEKQQYDFSNNSCSYICGHYTQVVWASTYKVGCAVQVCPNGIKDTTFEDREGAIFVCNYATAGNMEGEQPYETGSPCSDCKGECKENLCHTQEERQTSTFWTPDWDPDLRTCGSTCVAILALRPLALVVTFIAAYGVHYFYPDIFCYE